MGKNLFSVPIFFIVFRETLEAAIIVSVLLGLVEQIILHDPTPTNIPQTVVDDSKDVSQSTPVSSDPEDPTIRNRRLIRKLRIQVTILSRCVIRILSNCLQIFLGAGLGFLIALSIGAACVVYFDIIV